MKQIVWTGAGRKNILYVGSFFENKSKCVEDHIADRLVKEFKEFKLVKPATVIKKKKNKEK